MTDEGVPHVRLGRSRLLQKEELMYGEAVYHQKPIGQRHRVTPKCIDSPQHHHPETLTHHSNNALSRQRQPKSRIKHQRQTTNQYSSSDESAPRLPNKCKSTSSIDTQSVNNILDEFQDLDCSESSASSISVTNFESMMNQRRKLRNERQVIKVNQQTQVRQRSRDRAGPKSPEKSVPLSPTKQPPEMLMFRKGEVQKRVDEWLLQSQTQHQIPGSRISLTRSTSSAEQKRRLIPPEMRLNGTTSCDDLNSDQTPADEKAECMSIGVNTANVNYREYIRNRIKIENDTVTSNSMTSRIPQRQTVDKNSRIKCKQSNGVCRLTPRHSFKRTRSSDRWMPNKAGESRPVRQNKVEEIVQRVELATEIHLDTDDNNCRRPPAPPRRTHRSDLSSCSSFKPNKTVVNGTASAPHYTRDVEKIYDKSLRPEVIHADDLRAILEPSAKSSAYGESFRDDTVTNEVAKMYPDIGLDQCLRIQRRLPKSTSIDKKVMDSPKDFQALQVNATVNLVENEPTYETLENIIKDSYEAMSTLKLDRHLAAAIEDEKKFDVKGSESIHQKPMNEVHSDEQVECEIRNTSPNETKVSVNEVLVKNLCFHQDLPRDNRNETFRGIGVTSYQKPFNFNSVLSDDYEARLREASAMQECKIYVTKEEMERQRLMDLLRKRDYDAVKMSHHQGGKKLHGDSAYYIGKSLTIGCLQSAGTRGSPEGGGGGGVGGGGIGIGMCCVLQGADRVCPSTAGDKQAANSNIGNCGTPVTIHDLPLESLWAAGLDDGMGFPQHCSYSNHHTIPATPSTNPEETWRDRNPPYRTPTTSTGIGSSITDEIWTSANERKFFRTSTTSTGIGSSLNLHENNRSLESHNDDFYPTDMEDKDNQRRSYYQTTPTTSGIGSSIEKTQSIDTPQSHDLPDHLWSSAMGDGFARYNGVKSLQTITRQPRPNHDWVKTERIARFTKHRTISQSPDFDSEDIWTSRLNENGITGYGTQRSQHRCQHQTRRSFSTSIMADLTGTPSDSQQSLGGAEFLELERSYTLSTPGGGSPVCCPPCSPPPAPAAYISSIRASSRKFGGSGPTSPDRDPVGRLLRYLKMYYRELGTRDPRHLPPWILPLPLGTLCPAHFQPHLQLMHKNDQEHRLEAIKIDQIFATVRLSDGLLSEAPRRVAIEGGPGSGRTTLCLRLLHQWASKDDGPALAFIIPLRELRGTSVLNYLTREFLSKSASLTEAMAQVWRTLHLLEDRVLFILDGYDECPGGRQSLADAIDLLEARLFPDARILVTCSPNNWTSLSPMVQRRIHLAGLEWPHVERLCVAYFIHNNLSERACDFLECLSIQCQSIKELVQHPLGWIMLCTLYQDCGTLPSQPNAVVQEAVKSIIRKCLDRPLAPDEELPAHCRKRLEDFGKLSLSALREGRCCYTESEIRTRGGGIEILRLGFLSRGFTFGQRRKIEQYTPIHMAIAEFFAAYYLASISQYANILRREIEGLPSGIIGYLAGLLGPRTHLVLNQLCPLEVPSRTIFSLLKAAGTSDGNILAVCRLLGAAPGFGPVPNERPPAPLVQTSPLELEGWSKILGSSACTLEALEVVFQVERGADPTHLNDFFKALGDNESVKLVRITSLLGQEFPADEAQRLAGHLKSVLSKKRLNDFELVITCLEESAHDRLECVVNALCRGLGNASAHLARLVLDMNLSGEQVRRVCTALRDCVQVQALHLPHLSCGCEGLASVAELLKERPLLALNLAGSWGAKNEDPSSSGISMGSGSGSGSSGCASSTLGTLPLNNRCYSSLPRGALAAYGSLTRPATLPRLPLGIGLGTSGNGNGTLPQNDRDRDSSNGSSKRNSDSVLCHRLPLMHPLPTCDVACHQGTGFHEIFNAIREPNCRLRSLNVSKCLQGGLDAGCLGETIRRARNLDAVRAAGASRPVDVMPLVLALTEAPCLQLLDLASPRLAMDDHPSRLLCHALARNSTLRLLSLEGWTFRIEESDTLSVFSELLTCTSVRELSLCNARLHLAVHEGPLSRLGRRDDAGAELLRAAPPPACPTIVFLRLAGFQVSVNDRLALRGPLLLPFLAGFTALSELDLSLDKSEIGGSSGSLLFIDDKILQQFFASLSTHFKHLQTLKINYWRINLEDSDKTMRQISKHLKTSNISFIKANGLIVTDSVKRLQMEHLFIQTLLANLQCLTWLCLDGVKLTESQSSSIGKWIKERYPGILLEISAKDIQVKSIKALVGAVEEGGRADVTYIGGSTCRIKINKLQKNAKTRKK